MLKKLFKPGEKAPESGQIQEVGPDGDAEFNRETTVIQGKPFPPTSKEGNFWKFVDITKHKKR